MNHRVTCSLPHFLPRSLTPNSQSTYNRQVRFTPEINNQQFPPVHLIQCDLWEAITGEHVLPDNICNLCIPYFPSSETSSGYLEMQYYNMAKDRQSCRTLQQKIDECDTKERELITNALIPHLEELVFDPSSNYVIQKLCEYLDKDSQKKILDFFLLDIKRIVEQQSSCRVLQKFIEHTSEENVDKIFLSLKDIMIPMCSSPNGNHIIQRFIEMLPNRLDEIVNILQPHVHNLVIDNCGCRVIQKLFDKYPLSKLRPLADEVLSCAADLATNQYGNYVVQNILESGSDDDFSFLINEFQGAFYQFSIHKFASNVIEKCIRRANNEQRNAIFKEIIGEEDNFDVERIYKMVGDQFGNYVIQRIIEFGSETQQYAIYEVVHDHYDDLCKRQYAKHVIMRLNNLGYNFDE